MAPKSIIRVEDIPAKFRGSQGGFFSQRTSSAVVRDATTRWNVIRSTHKSPSENHEALPRPKFSFCYKGRNYSDSAAESMYMSAAGFLTFGLPNDGDYARYSHVGASGPAGVDALHFGSCKCDEDVWGGVNPNSMSVLLSESWVDEGGIDVLTYRYEGKTCHYARCLDPVGQYKWTYYDGESEPNIIVEVSLRSDNTIDVVYGSNPRIAAKRGNYMSGNFMLSNGFGDVVVDTTPERENSAKRIHLPTCDYSPVRVSGIDATLPLPLHALTTAGDGQGYLYVKNSDTLKALRLGFNEGGEMDDAIRAGVCVSVCVCVCV
jgi:hypothetical protein